MQEGQNFTSRTARLRQKPLHELKHRRKCTGGGNKATELARKPETRITVQLAGKERKWRCPLCEKTPGILGALLWDGSEAKQQFRDQD